MAREQPPSEPEDIVEIGRERSGRSRPLAAWRGVVPSGIALVLAAGLGFLIGYLVFNDSAPSDPASANVDHACAMAERLVETHSTEDDWGSVGEDPVFHEAQVIGQLLQATALQDDQYQHLTDPGARTSEAIQRLDFEQFIDATTEIARECEDL